MKIQIASDLHFEFLAPHKYERLINTFTGEADILVLAGDIVPLRFVDTVRDTLGPLCEKYKDVVYVPGNHEFYKSTPKDCMSILGAVQNEIPNLHVLKNNLHSIQDQWFFGGTMWFEDQPGNASLKGMLNDFNLIKDFEPWVYQQNANFEREFHSNVGSSTIVVTHHLPSNNSVPERFKDFVPGAPSLNRFFVNDMAGAILQKQPKLWIHGHTHDSCDYEIYKTRVLCNPYGYPSEGQRNKFNPNLIVEI